MDTRFYRAQGLDVAQVAQSLAGILQAQGYQVQHFGNKDHMAVQLRQGSDLEAFIGMQAALTVTLQRTPEGMIAAVGQQQWADKAAIGAIGLFFLWPLIVTAGAGVIRQATLEGQLFHTLDGVVMQLRPDARIDIVPPEAQGQWQQPGPPPPWQQPGPPPPFAPGAAPGYAPAPGAGTAPCPKCGEISEVGDAYCSHCGTSLQPEKKRCPQCNAEVKSSAAFCTQCGTSFSHEESSSKQ